jgi:hypothetical protein
MRCGKSAQKAQQMFPEYPIGDLQALQPGEAE